MAEWFPKQALCPSCEVMRAVVALPAPPEEKRDPSTLAYFVEEHAWEPGAPRCRGSGARVCYPHEFIHPPEVKAA